MIDTLTTEQVWHEIQENLFGVIGMVTAGCEARTVGIVYVVRNRRLYIVSDHDAWKIRHILRNPHVSMTVPISKRIPFLPWIKIPSATITFAGEARVLATGEVPPDILAALFRGLEIDEEKLGGSCIIEVQPVGDFITYGVGMPMMQMRDTERARGRAPVCEPSELPEQEPAI